ASLEVVLLGVVPEAAEAHAEQLRRAHPDAVGTAEGLGDVLALDGADVLFELEALVRDARPCGKALRRRNLAPRRRLADDVLREAGGLDLGRRLEGDGALDGVFEFPDVARPVIALERLDGLGAEPRGGTRHRRGGPLEEVLREQRDVLDALP